MFDTCEAVIVACLDFQLNHWTPSCGPVGLRGTELIRMCSGIGYPRLHNTLWRRADRAIQRLRRKGVIVYNVKRKTWHLTPEWWNRGGCRD